jgi:hypothetical protein
MLSCIRRLDPEKLEIAKAEFKKKESTGIIRCLKSPRASPLHMVPKNTDPGGLVVVSIW